MPEPGTAASTFSERLEGDLQPTIGASTYVKPQDMDWKPLQFEGVDLKVLYANKQAGEMTCLLRWQLGVTLPFHKHADLEQSWVLSGSFSDHDGTASAGEYVWRKPGSMHETYSKDGCIILAIYGKPNIFRNSAGFEPGAKRINTQGGPTTFKP